MGSTRPAMLALLIAGVAALSGCISIGESDHRHDNDPYDDGCWMFCGDSYDATFYVFPALAFLFIVGIVVLVIVVAVSASRPQDPPQTVIIKTVREKDD